MKYEITYNCGHSGSRSFLGPGKERDYLIKRATEGLCPDCYAAELQKKRDKENGENAQIAKEQELPELLGTLKQVAFGETCRQQVIAKLQLIIIRPQVCATQTKIEAAGDMSATLQYLIQRKRYAKYWIEAKQKDSFRLMDLLVDEKLNMDAEILAGVAPVPERIKIPDNPEAVVRPDDAKTEVIVTIRVIGNVIEVHMPERRDDFNKLIQTLKCTRSAHRWQRTIHPLNGTVADRAAEIGHRILYAGFIVRIPDDHIRQKAIDADYEQEYTNWVKVRVSGDYTGWFAITWDKDDDYYKVARRITESQYYSGRVVVPPHQFEEVLGFAEHHDFKFSPGAREALEKAQADRNARLIISAQPPAEKTSVTVKNIPPTLPVPEEIGIDEEFKDND